MADIMAVLEVEDQIESAKLELIEGEAVPGALYLTTMEDEYYLISDVAFDDTYELTVVAGGQKYVLTITDAEQTAVLNYLIHSVDIQNSNNETVIQDGNNIVVDFTKEYKFIFKFKENETWQYANNQDMYYELPDGVDLNLTQPLDFDIRIGARIITGNTYQVVTVDGKKKIKINFNTSHYNYPFLEASQDVEIDLQFSGKMTQEYTQKDLNFGAEVNGYSVQNKKVTNSKVRKEGQYDSAAKQMKYQVYVTATEESPANINVKDTISGSALTFNSITSIKEYSDENGNHYIQDIALNTLSNNTSSLSNGFDITIPSIPEGHTYKIEYTADINFDAIAVNNNATVSETGNTVRISAEGDEDQTDNESKHEEKNINFSSISKTGSVGNIIKENGQIWTPEDTGYEGKTYRIVNWRVVANTEGLVSLKDSPITDTLLNNDIVEYYGDGITVKKADATAGSIDWTSITGTNVAWSAVGVTDKVTAGGWSYTPTDNGNYAYEITYQTRVDLSAIGTGESVDVVNGIKDNLNL